MFNLKSECSWFMDLFQICVIFIIQFIYCPEDWICWCKLMLHRDQLRSSYIGYSNGDQIIPIVIFTYSDNDWLCVGDRNSTWTAMCLICLFILHLSFVYIKSSLDVWSWFKWNDSGTKIKMYFSLFRIFQLMVEFSWIFFRVLVQDWLYIF